jgi:tight adherence protein B
VLTYGVAGLAALAVWWLVTPPATTDARDLSALASVPRAGSVPGLRPARWGAWPAALVAAAGGGVVVLTDGTTLALGLVLVAVAAAAWGLVRRVRARRAAEQTADTVVEACESLAGELRAGQPPLRALAHSSEVWPALVPVATAGRLGADVPTALRRLARTPGAEGLHEAAAAWQVAERAGSTMAPALARVADAARRRRATDRLVASELASARATARLVAGLPFLVLALGSGLGGDPWGFLVGTAPGLVCLGAGLLLALAGLAWIERIAESARRR